MTGDAELRLIHSIDHSLEDVAISCVPNLYTWNPNDPCFHWKRPGLQVPGICKYCIYIYMSPMDPIKFMLHPLDNCD